MVESSKNGMQTDYFGNTLSFALQELRRVQEANKKISLEKPYSNFRNTTSIMAQRHADQVMKTYDSPKKK
jgi:hypothetical protein